MVSTLKIRDACRLVICLRLNIPKYKPTAIEVRSQTNKPSAKRRISSLFFATFCSKEQGEMFGQGGGARCRHSWWWCLYLCCQSLSPSFEAIAIDERVTHFVKRLEKDFNLISYLFSKLLKKLNQFKVKLSSSSQTILNCFSRL